METTLLRFGMLSLSLMGALAFSSCSISKTSPTDLTLPGLRRLDHFAVHVTDLPKSAEFYQRVFGFDIINKWKNYLDGGQRPHARGTFSAA